ncbi:hypothetical protein F4054_02195 [Candidatus Poribacteria bacterium]|nr:hypothetical protein [Candidatus Poribacteria bacterium]MYK21053.1 hypothetical protein [Candidatus Poribacteria bacterium]
MSAISKKQAKTEDLHNYPFDANIFRRTFNRYVQRFKTIFLTLVFLICAPFIAYAIAWYLGEARVDTTGFFDLWHAIGSLLLDWGFPYINYRPISLEMISFGMLSCGVISMGFHVSCGIISVGGFVSCGLISVGGLSSFGLIALGGNNVYGVIAIAIGNKKPFEKGVYMNGKAFGVIAIGRQAHGVYSLSYGEEGEGTYQFSPKRQDPEAIALFTSWFKKFKNAFVSPS